MFGTFAQSIFSRTRMFFFAAGAFLAIAPALNVAIANYVFGLKVYGVGIFIGPLIVGLAFLAVWVSNGEKIVRSKGDTAWLLNAQKSLGMAKYLPFLIGIIGAVAWQYFATEYYFFPRVDVVYYSMFVMGSLTMFTAGLLLKDTR
jgi:hypothetical protein